jgi:hypothetical protein
MAGVTKILASLERDESQSADQLLSLVQKELCRLAARHLAKDASGQTPDNCQRFLRGIAKPHRINRTSVSPHY